MEKLYVDFPRVDSHAVVRALFYVADELHLLINGGNGKYTARSLVVVFIFIIHHILKK